MLQSYQTQTGKGKTMHATTQKQIAVIIARTSGDGDKSIDWQIAECKRFCERQGIAVHKIFTEAEISGGKYIPKQIAPLKYKFIREGLSDAITEIENGFANVIVANDFSRISRLDTKTGLQLLEYLNKINAKIMLANDYLPGNLTSANGELQLTIFLAVNSAYRKTISEKLLLKKAAMKKQGIKLGGVTVYGFNNEEEKENVIKIFNDFASGKSGYEIAKEMNEKGKTKRNCFWGTNRIKKLLSNVNYIGLTKDLIPSATYKRIVSDDVFYRVQKIFDSRKGAKEKKYEHPFSGFCECGNCGKSLYIFSKPMIYAKGKRDWIHKYICKHCKGITYVPEKELDLIMRNLIPSLKRETYDIDLQAQSKLEKIKLRFNKMKKEYESGEGDISDEEYFSSRKSMLANIAKLENELKRKTTTTETNIKDWNALNYSEKREAMYSKIKTIVAESECIRIKMQKGVYPYAIVFPYWKAGKNGTRKDLNPAPNAICWANKTTIEKWKREGVAVYGITHSFEPGFKFSPVGI